MKLTAKLFIYSIISSLVTIPTLHAAGYHSEASDNRNSASAEAKAIQKQHRSIDSNVKSNARSEHKDVDQVTTQKLDAVIGIKDPKARTNAIKAINQTAKSFHKDVDDRKDSHLSSSARLKEAHLKESRDRHNRQAAAIKRAHGKSIKGPRTPDTASAAKKQQRKLKKDAQRAKKDAQDRQAKADKAKQTAEKERARNAKKARQPRAAKRG